MVNIYLKIYCASFPLIKNQYPCDTLICDENDLLYYNDNYIPYISCRFIFARLRVIYEISGPEA